MIRNILLLGNPALYKKSLPVKKEELNELKTVVDDLHDTLIEFKKNYGAGRAIAAPQIGVFKRLIYMYVDKPQVFINPSLTFDDDEKMTVWDDCMSFPNLLVKVSRYKIANIKYLDMNWKYQFKKLEGDFSELLQHEYDHLDGILAISRAIDDYSFALKSQKNLLLDCNNKLATLNIRRYH
ncbi:peptide deformylase [Sporolactobacillus laevolacticus]|uniref:Peptide deformylase n=1 Tax=Sporolactobacillus laevolacticus DSM 442 TaxID=1395513 RepID=V6IV23_9BACL|nr:peptide deformylase [Sporolactobacillus laevolacticus]EST10296.1 peptide deformylase [Sporolactobacillus laevolacticus DSM 442]